MNYEELVESKKSIGNMSKEELFTYCNGLLNEIWEFKKDIKELFKENENKEKVIKAQDNIIKEVREYINKIPTQPVIRVFKKELLEILDKEKE